MDSLIEKFGMKKIAFVFGVFAVIMVLVLLLLKHSGGEDVLYKCSKSADYYNFFNMNMEVSLGKVGKDTKVSFNYVVSNSNDNYKDLFDSFKTNLSSNFENNLTDIFYDNIDDVSYNVNIKDNVIEYGFSIVLNGDNSEDIKKYMNYDFYNTSVEDSISYLEGSGFICEK